MNEELEIPVITSYKGNSGMNNTKQRSCVPEKINSGIFDELDLKLLTPGNNNVTTNNTHPSLNDVVYGPILECFDITDIGFLNIGRGVYETRLYHSETMNYYTDCTSVSYSFITRYLTVCELVDLFCVLKKRIPDTLKNYYSEVYRSL